MNFEIIREKYNRLSLIFILFLLSFSFCFFSIYAQQNCQKHQKIEICIEECAINTLCKILIHFQGKQLYVFPANSDYIIIADNPVKFLKFYAITFNVSPAKLEIVPLKKEFKLEHIVLDNVFYTNITIIVPEKIELTINEKIQTSEEKERKENNFLEKIKTFNIFYLIFIGIFLVLIAIYEIVSFRRTVEKDPANKNEKIESQEEVLKQYEALSNIQQNADERVREEEKEELMDVAKIINAIELSIHYDQLQQIVEESNKKTVEDNKKLNLEIIRKTILLSKAKGLPKDAVYKYLKNKYNDQRILKELIDEIYG